MGHKQKRMGWAIQNDIAGWLVGRAWTVIVLLCLVHRLGAQIQQNIYTVYPVPPPLLYEYGDSNVVFVAPGATNDALVFFGDRRLPNARVIGSLVRAVEWNFAGSNLTVVVLPGNHIVGGGEYNYITGTYFFAYNARAEFTEPIFFKNARVFGWGRLKFDQVALGTNTVIDCDEFEGKIMESQHPDYQFGVFSGSILRANVVTMVADDTANGEVEFGGDLITDQIFVRPWDGLVPLRYVYSDSVIRARRVQYVPGQTNGVIYLWFDARGTFDVGKCAIPLVVGVYNAPDVYGHVCGVFRSVSFNTGAERRASGTIVLRPDLN